jgi:hypothetical protein
METISVMLAAALGVLGSGFVDGVATDAGTVLGGLRRPVIGAFWPVERYRTACSIVPGAALRLDRVLWNLNWRWSAP